MYDELKLTIKGIKRAAVDRLAQSIQSPLAMVALGMGLDLSPTLNQFLPHRRHRLLSFSQLLSSRTDLSLLLHTSGRAAIGT